MYYSHLIIHLFDMMFSQGEVVKHRDVILRMGYVLVFGRHMSSTKRKGEVLRVSSPA